MRLIPVRELVTGKSFYVNRDQIVFIAEGENEQQRVIHLTNGKEIAINEEIFDAVLKVDLNVDQYPD